ncbi:hypothetical protein [Micromonospora sp. b486]|nr:hypothetical protein [Micromonospora sp. b486]MDM4784582.1 hypothetical protein [Micromonospora sp. b486]
MTWLRAYVRDLLAERERRGRDDDPLAGLLATADPAARSPPRRWWTT